MKQLKGIGATFLIVLGWLAMLFGAGLLARASWEALALGWRIKDYLP